MPRKLSWKSRSTSLRAGEMPGPERARLMEAIADCIIEPARTSLAPLDQIAETGRRLARVFAAAEADLLLLACQVGEQWRMTNVLQKSNLDLPPPATPLPGDFLRRLKAQARQQTLALRAAPSEFPADWARWAGTAGAEHIRLFPEPVSARGLWIFSGDNLLQAEWASLLDFAVRLLAAVILDRSSPGPAAHDRGDSVLEREFARWLKAREPRLLCEMLGQQLADQFGMDRSLFLYQGLDDPHPRSISHHGVDSQVTKTAITFFQSDGRAAGRLALLGHAAETASPQTTTPLEEFTYSLAARAQNGTRIVGVLGGREKPRLTPGEQRRLERWITRFELALDNQQRAARLEALSYTDSLTGIFNRRFFRRRLAEETTRARRFGRSLSLLVFDLDNFKELNDNYGHQAGDLVLRDVAAVLSTTIRSIDVACRYGGDEFVIVMPETMVQDCFSFTNRLRCAIFDHAFRPGGQGETVRLTISLGAAVFPEHADSPERLFWCADMAMLKAKEAGRNRAMLYQPGMDCSPRTIGR